MKWEALLWLGLCCAGLGAWGNPQSSLNPGGFRGFLQSEYGIDTTWIGEYGQDGPFGFVIKGWQFAPCTDAAWTDYPVNVTNVQLWPKFPRFPGPIFFNFSFEVKERLPRGAVELATKVRHKVRSAPGSSSPHTWELIPCTGWDVSTGCGGGGSCRYCDVIRACRKTVRKAKKYTSNREVLDVLSNAKKLCPPPKGTWSISYSKVFKLQDIEKGILGPLQSNEYWFSVKIKSTRSGRSLGCFRLWLNICKYRARSKAQRCIRDPNAYRSFVNRLAQEARQIFQGRPTSPHRRSGRN